MLILKRHSFKAPEDDKEFFVQLERDTTEPERGEEHKRWLFTESRLLERKFAGEVDQDSQEFRIRCARTDILEMNLSMFEFYGHVKRSILGKIIEVEVDFNWITLLRKFMFTLFLSLSMITALALAGWILTAVLVGAQLFFSMRDLEQSEEKVQYYIESHRRIQAQRVVSSLSVN